ncbi:LytTR family transcriptional regulator DNA-binding domain-containing protein [Paenibacillus sp. 2TAB26]|uniref:LytTR family transcriptional regulator DNA-binding domain-containing protein n=1 Tax=Paenibacillus sp. 2TAB26 TaxID=3233005 RepID=UPI003F997526
MHKLTVTRDAYGESGIYNISCDIVNYMESESNKKRILVHTPYENYYMMGTLKYWSVVLNTSGYKFLDLDRNILVNVDNIVLMSNTTKEVYFDLKIDKNSMKCGIAFHKYSKYKRIILSFNPNIIIV